jgi:dethiobiotin synthetase
VNRAGPTRIIFITGTDTGVGKTLLTALLLRHLRQRGCHALAMKPFCSGSWSDARLLRAAQDSDLTLDEIAPWFFPEPVAPLVSARRHRRSVRLSAVTRQIRATARRAECLLVEGSGGLLVPLGEGFTVRDLINKLGCEVIVVARDRLGTINHTLLTVEALQLATNAGLTTVLMGAEGRDYSTQTNCRILAEMLAPVPVMRLPFLGTDSNRVEAVKESERKVRKRLARILEVAIFAPTFFVRSKPTAAKEI